MRSRQQGKQETSREAAVNTSQYLSRPPLQRAPVTVEVEVVEESKPVIARGVTIRKNSARRMV